MLKQILYLNLTLRNAQTNDDDADDSSIDEEIIWDAEHIAPSAGSEGFNVKPSKFGYDLGKQQ